MQIIDGYTGAPNIYADDIGQYNISLYGNGDYVLPVGEQLGYELVSNNEIKIKDGFFITQGRRGVIKKGTTESCVIENGTQAENRNDLIIIEYAKDESKLIESHTMKVIKGTPGETAADPTTITGNIPNGAVLHQMPLYRVKLEGLNIVAVEQLFTIGKIAPETVDPLLATEEGFAADAKLTGNELKSLNSNLPFALGIDTDGNYGYIKDGADSVTPFSNFEVIINYLWGGWSSGGSNTSKSYTCARNGKMFAVVYASYWSNTPQGNPSTKCKINGVSQSYKNTTESTPGVFQIYELSVQKDDLIEITSTCYAFESGNSYKVAYIGLFYL